jgi:hypothetical protein
MGRSLVEIREEIEYAVRRRADVYRRQSCDGTPELAEIRAGIDAELRLLWEEYREARVDMVGMVDLSAEDVRRIIRHNPRVVLA